MVKTNPCLLLGFLIFVCSCKSIHEIEQVPNDTYRITGAQYRQLGGQPTGSGHRSLVADVTQSDSTIAITPEFENTRSLKLKLDAINSLKMYRYTFDIDVLTVPFKIRPAVSGFPEQLNANFDAALYFGRRRDSYTIEKKKKGRAEFTRIRGVGYGYGGFIGIGSTTMNPYVTNQQINYEYDGFVLNGGLAGIYDAKRFNLGLALGADFLVDKNRHQWIYQGKPWIGVLFGINLN